MSQKEHAEIKTQMKTNEKVLLKFLNKCHLKSNLYMKLQYKKSKLERNTENATH